MHSFYKYFLEQKKLSKTSLFPDNNKCMLIRFPIFKLNIITLEKHSQVLWKTLSKKHFFFWLLDTSILQSSRYQGGRRVGIPCLSQVTTLILISIVHVVGYIFNDSWLKCDIYSIFNIGAVIVWQLDLQQPLQSVPVTTDVVSSNLDQGEVYNIM